MKARSKVRLVKADSRRADHNREQARRLPPVERQSSRKARNFNPLTPCPTNEETLAVLGTKLVWLESELKRPYSQEQLEEIEAQARACRIAITTLERYIANQTSRELREEVQAVMYQEIVKRPRKAISKVPKTSGHGLRGKPEPYTGPGKPNGPKIGRKATLVTAWPESSEPMTGYKPLKWPNEYNGHSDGFRSWASKHPFRKNGNGNGRK